jgi:hypothetical protein
MNKIDGRINYRIDASPLPLSQSHGLRILGTVVFVLLSFSCLIWQLTLILQMYFEYNVATKTAIVIPKDFDLYDFNICVKYADLIDYDRLDKDKGRKWKYSDGIKNYKKYLSIMTVDELFEYSPNADEVVDRIDYKSLSSSRIFSVKGNDPNVKVIKYIYRAKVCFMIGLYEEDFLTYRLAALSSASTGLIRMIHLSQKMEKMDTLKMALGHKGAIPLHGLMVSPYIYRRLNEVDGTANYSSFVSHHYSMKVTSLPPPYETRCYDYDGHGFLDELECMENCTVQKTFDEFQGKVPYMSVMKTPTNQSFLGYTDLEDTFNDSKFSRIQDECSNFRCNRQDCKDDQVLTTTSISHSNKLTWSHVTPIQPSFNIKSSPALSLLEVIIYCFGSISTFTGLCVIKMNPFLLLKKRSQTKSKSCITSILHGLISLNNI